MPDIFNPSQPQIKPEVLPATDPVPKNKHVPQDQLSPFSTFCRFPQDIRFQNQEQGEDVHLVVRRHFITNVPWILTAFTLSFLPAFLLITPIYEALGAFLSPIASLLFLVFYYVIIFGYIFVNYVTWFYHIGIVTNMRVLDIDVTHISSKNVAATNIADIVDVEYSQSGFISNFFDLGNVNLQTEGLKPNFEFTSIPKPARVTDIISDLIAGRPSNE